MKNKNTLINEYNQILDLKYTKVDEIKKKENSGYRYYGNAWASVVSLDIVGFKNIVNKVDNENVVKIIQLFTETVITTAKDEMFSDIFRDAYFAGDEVLVVFDGNKKEKISRVVDFAFYVSTQINSVLSQVLVSKIGNLNTFKVGVGVWTSNDNTLVYNGYNKSENFNASTLIGNAINYASSLASIANRGRYPGIMINYITKNNLIGNTKESADKWMRQYNISGELNNIYGGDIVKTMYK
ncbi:MAG: hypothetical protein KAG14_00415 [Mycoplasmataceae bacterium]|nr:hypothetical protein [Mycoplasmataceae bacterium]